MRASRPSSFILPPQVCANHSRARAQAAQALLSSQPSLGGEPGKPTLEDESYAARRSSARSNSTWRQSSITSLFFGYFIADFQREKLVVAATEDAPTWRAVIFDVTTEPRHREVSLRGGGPLGERNSSLTSEDGELDRREDGCDRGIDRTATR